MSAVRHMTQFTPSIWHSSHPVYDPVHIQHMTQFTSSIWPSSHPAYDTVPIQHMGSISAWHFCITYYFWKLPLTNSSVFCCCCCSYNIIHPLDIWKLIFSTCHQQQPTPAKQQHIIAMQIHIMYKSQPTHCNKKQTVAEAHCARKRPKYEHQLTLGQCKSQQYVHLALSMTLLVRALLAGNTSFMVMCSTYCQAFSIYHYLRINNNNIFDLPINNYN